MGAKARKYVVDNYNLSKSGGIYLDAYKDIVSRPVSNRMAKPILSSISNVN